MSLANLTMASEGPQKETFQPPLSLFCPVTPTACKQALSSSYTKPRVNKNLFRHGLVCTSLCSLRTAFSVTLILTKHYALEHVFIGTGEGPRKVL